MQREPLRQHLTASDGHSACARVGGWDRLPAERVGEGEIGAGAGRRPTLLHLGRRQPRRQAETRRAYVAALQAADRGDIGPLMVFRPELGL